MKKLKSILFGQGLFLSYASQLHLHFSNAASIALNVAFYGQRVFPTRFGVDQ